MSTTPCLNQKDTAHGAKQGQGRGEARLASAWIQLFLPPPWASDRLCPLTPNSELALAAFSARSGHFSRRLGSPL